MTDTKTQISNQYYDASAAKWNQGHNTENFWGEHRDAFHALFPKGRLLEVGAGAGRDAKELIALDYDYVGVEPSAGMRELAEQNNPGATFVDAGVEDLIASGLGRFGGFWASASLLHRSRDTIRADMQAINAMLEPGAIGFISLKKHVDDGPIEREEPDDYGTRFFAYWTREEFEAVLNRTGFEVVYFAEKPMSEKTVWLIFIVKKLAEV